MANDQNYTRNNYCTKSNRYTSVIGRRKLAAERVKQYTANNGNNYFDMYYNIQIHYSVTYKNIKL